MTAEKEGVAASGDPHHQPAEYGTFQGAANYPTSGFPQPAPPPGATGHYARGYQSVPGYVVAEGTPASAREGLLPCCGCGLGWCLFIMGFFIAGIPWYCGAIILFCVQTVDYREKPGYIACTIAAVLFTIAGIIGGASQA